LDWRGQLAGCNRCGRWYQDMLGAKPDEHDLECQEVVIDDFSVLRPDFIAMP
jgi:hypothetical protein